MGALGALVEANGGVVAVLGTLALGSACAAVAFLTGGGGWEKIAGWVFVVSAVLAWYVASAMMLAAAGGREVLPLFKGQVRAGEPGVKQGQ